MEEEAEQEEDKEDEEKEDEQQRGVVIGTFSEWAPVVSGAP